MSFNKIPPVILVMRCTPIMDRRMENMNSAAALPAGITADGEGKLRWTYELNLWRHPMMLYSGIKAMSIAVLSFGVLVASVRIGMDGIAAGADFLGWYLLIALAVMLTLFGLSYLILCLFYWGRYVMMFEMDEKGVLYAQAPRQHQKARKLGMLTVLVGAVAKSSGISVAGFAAVNRSFYSRFSEVRKVKAVRKHNLIRVNGLFVKNQVYASPEQYDFVWEYITSRCRRGKIYE